MVRWVLHLWQPKTFSFEDRYSRCFIPIGGWGGLDQEASAGSGTGEGRLLAGEKLGPSGARADSWEAGRGLETEEADMSWKLRRTVSRSWAGDWLAD